MRKEMLFICGFLYALLIIAGLIRLLGFRINTSDSIPKGLYRITANAPLKNSFVIFCPHDNEAFQEGLTRGYIHHGLCPNGYGYLMKKVVAVAGDVVSINAQGVFVNGHLLPFSKPKPSDSLNRPMPSLNISHYRLNEDEVLTMTNQSEWSFDGRYYGLIHIRQIKGIVKPVMTWRLKH